MYWFHQSLGLVSNQLLGSLFLWCLFFMKTFWAGFFFYSYPLLFEIDVTRCVFKSLLVSWSDGLAKALQDSGYRTNPDGFPYKSGPAISLEFMYLKIKMAQTYLQASAETEGSRLLPKHFVDELFNPYSCSKSSFLQ